MGKSELFMRNNDYFHICKSGLILVRLARIRGFGPSRKMHYR